MLKIFRMAPHQLSLGNGSRWSEPWKRLLSKNVCREQLRNLERERRCRAYFVEGNIRLWPVRSESDYQHGCIRLPFAISTQVVCERLSIQLAFEHVATHVLDSPECETALAGMNSERDGPLHYRLNENEHNGSDQTVIAF